MATVDQNLKAALDSLDLEGLQAEAEAEKQAKQAESDRPATGRNFSKQAQGGDSRFEGLPPQLQPRKATQRLVSDELRALITNYAASQTAAMALHEVKWEPLAARLGTNPDFLREVAEHADGEDGDLWMAVLLERVKRVGASRMFRDITWERLETRTLEFLHTMVDKGFVRDAGELLAIANTARKVSEPTQGGGFNGNNVNINISQGDGFMAQDQLPSSGAKMTIDLSPRMATALNGKVAERPESRVIDGQMLTAKELRESMADFGSKSDKEVGDGE